MAHQAPDPGAVLDRGQPGRLRGRRGPPRRRRRALTAPGAAPGSADEAAFRAELRAWLADHRPRAPDLLASLGPEAEAAGRAWMRRLAEGGYAAVTWPLEHGGRGLRPAHAAIVSEELGRAGLLPAVGLVGLGMVGPTLLAAGTPEQRRRYLPALLRGEELWCQGFSEPGAGSDLAGVRTRAERRGGSLVLNGQKAWTTLAHAADRCLLLARTGDGATRHEGLTMLAVDMRAPGIEVRPVRQLTGELEFGEIFLTDVHVPEECVIGAVGDGWRVAMITLLHERATLGVALTASLQRQVGRLVELVRTTRPDDPQVRDRLAREWIELRALRLANERGLRRLAPTAAPGPEWSVIKLRWSEANQRVTRLALDLLGPEGIVGEPGAGPPGAWLRERLRSRANTIEAGTSEVLRAIVAERVLGLPRSR